MFDFSVPESDPASTPWEHPRSYTEGDGKADQREVLFTGFQEGNQQLRVNGLRWGLDNWVYCASGSHQAAFAIGAHPLVSPPVPLSPLQVIETHGVEKVPGTVDSTVAESQNKGRFAPFRLRHLCFSSRAIYTRA